LNTNHPTDIARQTQAAPQSRRIVGQKRDSLVGKTVRVVSRHDDKIFTSDTMRVIESLTLRGRRVVALAYECEVIDDEPAVTFAPRQRQPVCPKLGHAERAELVRFRLRYRGLTWEQLGRLFGVHKSWAQRIFERSPEGQMRRAFREAARQK